MSEPKPKVARYELQKAMAADIQAAVEKAQKTFNIDPNDVDAQRRFFRAVVTLAAQRLFELNADPRLIAGQAFEAIRSEHQRRHETALTLGQPFGPTVPAKA